MQVLFFPNGNTVVLENNEQIPELQESWLLLFITFLESKGVDPTKVSYRLPQGRAEVFRTPEGYSWRF